MPNNNIRTNTHMAVSVQALMLMRWISMVEERSIMYESSLTRCRPARITSHQQLICRQKRHELISCYHGHYTTYFSLSLSQCVCLLFFGHSVHFTTLYIGYIRTRYRWKHFFRVKIVINFLSLTYFHCMLFLFQRSEKKNCQIISMRYCNGHLFTIRWIDIKMMIWSKKKKNTCVQTVSS